MGGPNEGSNTKLEGMVEVRSIVEPAWGVESGRVRVVDVDGFEEADEDVDEDEPVETVRELSPLESPSEDGTIDTGRPISNKLVL